eukprot:9309313-Ditylum_brightwellii.AAC.1
MPANQQNESEEHVTKIFVSMIFQRNVCQNARANRTTIGGSYNILQTTSTPRCKCYSSSCQISGVTNVWCSWTGWGQCNNNSGLAIKIWTDKQEAKGISCWFLQMGWQYVSTMGCHPCICVHKTYIGLDKCRGIRLLGIVGILLHLVGKAIPEVCGQKVQNVCGVENLCLGVRAGVEGRIHAMNKLWEDFGHMDDWRILLVEARNALEAFSV